MSQEFVTEIPKPLKTAIFIPTNLPKEDDPRDIGERSIARFQVGIELARKLRDERGRANVLVVVFGGWPLHERLPLSIQHVYAANKRNLLKIDELDFVTSCGVNTVTDLHGTLKWMKENILNVNDAYAVTSKGHAARLIAEGDMHSLFGRVFHVESNEPRGDDDEDARWITRARNNPSHQYLFGARAADVSRNGTLDSFEWVQKTRDWAERNPDLFEKYMDDIWKLLRGLEENNVAVLSKTPGCWRMNINC